MTIEDRIITFLDDLVAEETILLSEIPAKLMAEFPTLDDSRAAFAIRKWVVRPVALCKCPACVQGANVAKYGSKTKRSTYNEQRGSS